MHSGEIDFVVLWVDDTDPVWCQKRMQTVGIETQTGNTEVRYRDWDNLRYWFRAVEKFAPWVRYVYFVTDNQKPEWLNIEHPKLKWIKHTDYIPDQYLPTFNSNVIELNLHRIEGLSECFVNFNDDMFLISPTQPEDFFVNDIPCDYPILGPLLPESFFSYTLFNNMYLINRHFNFRESVKANLWKWVKGQSAVGLLKLLLYGRNKSVSHSVSHHIHTCLCKRTYRTLWEKEYDLMHHISGHKVRTKEDISQWCIRDWQLLSGEFVPKKPIGRMFFTAEMSNNSQAIDYIRNQKGKVICLNDSEDETEFEEHKQQIIEAFEAILPEKSLFEL